MTRNHTVSIAAVALCMLMSACIRHQVWFPQNAPTGMLPQHKTVWTFGYFGQGNIELTDKDCPSDALVRVSTKTNFGYELLTVVTLGLVAPLEIEYVCAKPSSGGL